MSRQIGPAMRAWMAPRVRQADLAREAGVRRSYVHAVLAGEKPASAKLLDAARRLGIPVDQLAGTRPKNNP